MLSVRPRKSSGFTLIELLIVIGILAILAIVALIAINPGEAQKRTRDVQRVKDMATLQAALESYLADNPGAVASALTSGPKTSAGTGNRNCDVNWIGVDLCAYLNLVPVDPTNRSTNVTDAAGGTDSKEAFYYLNVTSAGQYKVCTYLESAANASKLEDGGNMENMLEVFSDRNANCGAPD